MEQPSERTEAEPRRSSRVRTALPWVLALALVATVAGVTASRGQGATAAQAALGDEQLRIMAPADPGGGWDQTSRTMQESLRDFVGRAEVYNVGGAGGTIGLSQFEQLDGQANQLMTTGLIMIGAIATNGSDVSLEDTTPLARLTTDSQVVVVPAQSEIQTMGQLAELMRTALPTVSIAGGSAGGTEQILAGLIAQELGQDPGQVNYIAHAGGGEAVATLLSGSAVAGISGISEIKPQIDAGQMRALAVSSAERVDLLPDVPTLMEQGIDIELTNWRGVVAPAGISDEQEHALEDLIMRMTRTDVWQQTLEQRGWGDVALAGPEFEDFLSAETQRIDAVIADLGLGPDA